MLNPVKNGMKQGMKGWWGEGGNIYEELRNAFSSGSLEDYSDEVVTLMGPNCKFHPLGSLAKQ